jgi:hypothetical protein
MIYPIDIAPVPQPPELVCFVKLSNGRIQDLSHLCGDQPPKPRATKLVASPIAAPANDLPPNANNFRPVPDQPLPAEPEEEEEEE